MNDHDIVDNNNEKININKILKRTTKGTTSILFYFFVYLSFIEDKYTKIVRYE